MFNALTNQAIRRRVGRALHSLIVGRPRLLSRHRLHEEYHFNTYDYRELALYLEEGFQLTLSDQEVAAFSTVGSVVACVRQNLRGQGAKTR